jgi:hypothetical protein
LIAGGECVAADSIIKSSKKTTLTGAMRAHGKSPKWGVRCLNPDVIVPRVAATQRRRATSGPPSIWFADLLKQKRPIRPYEGSIPILIVSPSVV